MKSGISGNRTGLKCLDSQEYSFYKTDLTDNIFDFAAFVAHMRIIFIYTVLRA